MKTILFSRLLLAAGISVLLYSCQKETGVDEPQVSSEQAQMYADESAQADAAFSDVEDITMLAAEEEGIAIGG